MTYDWGVFDNITEECTIHVVPLDDILPHEDYGDDCWCDPAVEVHGRNLMVTHNSFDGREDEE